VYIYIYHMIFLKLEKQFPAFPRWLPANSSPCCWKAPKSMAKILWTPGNHGGKRHIVTNILETLFLSFCGLQYIYMYVYMWELT
jgi:hypothetical protein